MKIDFMEIPLKNNKKAIVDAEDYPRLIKFRWWLFKNNCIATGIGSKKLKTRKNVPLSHMVLNLVGGSKKDVSYIDGNFLNNRKSNLIVKSSRTKLIGKKFGRLLVISFHHYDSKYRVLHWECKCDCGNTTVVPTTSLQRKERPSISCGCWRYDRVTGQPASNRLLKGRANFNSLFYTYKKAARQRDIDFFLVKEEFQQLTKDNCYYCDSKPIQIHGKQGTYGTYFYNGIDRLDSNKPYVLGNCVPCCKTCNYAKREMSVTEFKTWITQVYNYFGKRGE
jgi:hypothetical protein